MYSFAVLGGEQDWRIPGGIDFYEKYKQTTMEKMTLPQLLAVMNQTTSQQTSQGVARAADVGNAAGDIFLPAVREFAGAVTVFSTALYGEIKEHPIAAGVGI